ncbi:type 4b pilus protein PilO2 [Pseudomonas aeruginosa]
MQPAAVHEGSAQAGQGRASGHRCHPPFADSDPGRLRFEVARRSQGYVPLASALSGQFEGDFLACWKVDEDRYALVATLDGAIVPGQDLVTTFDEARDRIRKPLTRGVLRNAQVFVPEGSRFPRQGLRHRGTARAERLRRDYRLRQLTFGLSAREWTAVALLGCLVGGSLTAYYLWNAHQQELAR